MDTAEVLEHLRESVTRTMDHSIEQIEQALVEMRKVRADAADLTVAAVSAREFERALLWRVWNSQLSDVSAAATTLAIHAAKAGAL